MTPTDFPRVQARAETAERERDEWRRVAERLAAETEAATLRAMQSQENE